jgi:hypothetical protein
MCAGARVVEAVRERARDKGGLFDTIHVRRGGEQSMSMPLFNVMASTYTSTVPFIITDFQYKKTRLEAKELIKKSKNRLTEGGVLYIATDERDKSFFEPFREHYDIVFLDDFEHLLKGINTK